MRKLIILTLGMLTVATACQSGKEGDLSFDAEVKNVDNGTPVYISQLTNGNQTTPLDTVEVENGKISTSLPEVDFQTLNILRIKGVNGNMLFINENEPLTATIYKDSIRNSTVKGGSANEMFNDYMAHINASNEKMNQIMDSYSQDELQDPATQNEIRTKQAEIQDEDMAYRKEAIQDHPDELPSILMLVDMMNSQAVPQNEMKDLFDGLSSDLKETFIGEQVNNQLVKSEALSIGSKAPDFSAETPDGEELALKDALGDKYTLVDFWAAWCPPCRAENPNLVKVYEKYHDKGFNVLGVSLDKDKDKWVKAIEDDGLPWNQISNLKFWEDPIAEKYNIRAIPANFLLDEDGKIVATDLRGSALRHKLKELLGNQE